MSSRVKNTTANSYTIVKAIAEELRGLAVECNVPIMTATQTTRSGYSNSDIGLEDTSESFVYRNSRFYVWRRINGRARGI